MPDLVLRLLGASAFADDVEGEAVLEGGILRWHASCLTPKVSQHEDWATVTDEDRV